MIKKEITQKEKEYRAKIGQLKYNLSKTDYLAIKYAEGEITPVEYQEIKEKRKAWRAEINALQAMIQRIRGE